MNNDCESVGSGDFANRSYQEIPKIANSDGLKSGKSVRVWCDGWLALIYFIVFRL